MFGRFGRKPVVIATYLVIGIFGTSSAFAVSLVMYIVLKCVMGFICFAGFSATVALGKLHNNKSRDEQWFYIDL